MKNDCVKNKNRDSAVKGTLRFVENAYRYLKSSGISNRSYLVVYQVVNDAMVINRLQNRERSNKINKEKL